MTQHHDEPQRSRGLGVEEACEQLGIKRTTFYRLIRAGQLRAYDLNGAPKRRVGEKGPRRSLRVEQAEIDRFKRDAAVTQ